MKRIPLFGLTVQPTVLGFGCAALMGRGERHAQRLLETAFDAGIRHFDLAPLYGQGDAEKALEEASVRGYGDDETWPRRITSRFASQGHRLDRESSNEDIP
jgi:D-threo-aldose 1-dehydrogenase